MGGLTMIILSIVMLLLALGICYAALTAASDYDDLTDEEIEKFLYESEEADDEHNSRV